MKQKGLGRGLDAIFGSDPVDAKLKPMSQMAEIEIADIIPNPTQPRTQFDEGSTQRFFTSGLWRSTSSACFCPAMHS